MWSNIAGMQKIRIKIAALVKSDVHPNSYVIILKEEEGDRRLPIIIGAFEAQAIVMALERVEIDRPLTHDLIKNALLDFNIELKEIIISELNEGVFYSTLVCLDQEGNVMGIDSRTSDAIALAVRFDATIYVSGKIMEEAGIRLEEANKEDSEPSPPKDPEELEKLPLRRLEELLNEALAKEDYELAAKIRDEINNRQN